MPGELKRSARCPKCRTPIIALIDTTNSEGVTRELFHVRYNNGRRKRRCLIRYSDYETACVERRKLETRPKVSNKKEHLSESRDR